MNSSCHSLKVQKLAISMMELTKRDCRTLVPTFVENDIYGRLAAFFLGELKCRLIFLTHLQLRSHPLLRDSARSPRTLLLLLHLEVAKSDLHISTTMTGASNKALKREEYRKAQQNFQDGTSKQVQLPKKRFYRQRAHANPFSDHNLI